MGRLADFIHRPFVTSVSMFGVGAVTGFLVAALLPAFREAMATLLQVRVLEPLRSAMIMGDAAVVVLIFANNAVPVLLSFLYPILLTKVTWTPPLTKNKTSLLLTGYTVLAAFLLGFLDLGATLGSVFLERGGSFMTALLGHSWLHGPIEFTIILLAVSEPARIRSKRTNSRLTLFDRKDRVLLLSCLLGLLASAIIEFALNV